MERAATPSEGFLDGRRTRRAAVLGKHAPRRDNHARDHWSRTWIDSRVLIASLSFELRPEKRGEFVSAVNHMLQTIRWTAGCLGCRLVNDCENPNVFTLSSEWDSRKFLDSYLASPEFQILEGTRYLLRDGPGLSIDEVVARVRLPGPIRTLG